MSRKYKQYGGFNDLASFRAETGLTADEVPDEDALKAINGDLIEQKRLADMEKHRAVAAKDQEVAQLRAIRDEALQRKNLLENDLAAERNRRVAYENVLNPVRVVAPMSSLADYLTKESIKREVKREIDDEKRFNSAIRRRSVPRARSHSRPKSRPRPKPRAKSKSKKTKKRK